jgi:uncharacterized protein
MLSRRTLLKGLAGAGASFLALGAYAIGIEPMLRLEVVRHALTPPRWPAGFKLRIVLLSDIHACDPWMPLARVQSLVDTANGLGGDLVLLLGDYVSGQRLPHRDVDPAALCRILAGLKAPLGVHAIQGNHDWWEDEEAMRTGRGSTFMHRALGAAGIALLENDAVRLIHGGRPFWLAGLGDQIAFQWARRRFGFGGPAGADDLPATLAKITDDAPAILMAHEPDIFPRVPPRFALTLSGHTHGGQVNLLGWRPVAASDLSARYARGHFREDGRDLIVTSGLGCSIAPIRIGVPPEIMVVELGGIGQTPANSIASP